MCTNLANELGHNLADHHSQVLFTWSLVLATDCDGRFGAFEGCAKHPAPELMGRTAMHGGPPPWGSAQRCKADGCLSSKMRMNHENHESIMKIENALLKCVKTLQN